MTVLTVLTVQPADIVKTENTVVTVEIVETEETVLIEDLKKYQLPKNSVVLLTANMDTRDASASKNESLQSALSNVSCILHLFLLHPILRLHLEAFLFILDGTLSGKLCPLSRLE